MKILITGGHVTPALAVIDSLKNDHSFVFVGRKYSVDRDKTHSFEYREVTKRLIPFVHLYAGKLNRFVSSHALVQFLKIPVGFFQSLYILNRERPQVVLSFGGYIGLPVAYAAWMLGIPVYTHEQTLRPGLSNRLIGNVAKKVFVAFTEASRFFPQHKVVVTGNPVRAAIFNQHEGTIKIAPTNKKPVIYVTGGSLGSHSINEHILAILPRLKKKYFIIHQVGDVKEYDDFKKCREHADETYIPVKHITDEDVGNVYAWADLIISRCGANTIFEIIALKKPSILIPLPWSAHQEQQKHAQLLKDAGVAEIFSQSSKSEELLKCIELVLKNKKEYIAHFSHLQSLYSDQAVDMIASVITRHA